MKYLIASVFLTLIVSCNNSGEKKVDKTSLQPGRSIILGLRKNSDSTSYPKLLACYIQVNNDSTLKTSKIIVDTILMEDVQIPRYDTVTKKQAVDSLKHPIFDTYPKRVPRDSAYLDIAGKDLNKLCQKGGW